MEKKQRNTKLLFWSILICLILITTLICIEVAGQVVYRIKSGHWLFIQSNIDDIDGMFVAHPWLVGVPKPGKHRTKIVGKKTITISHNSLGFRGREVTVQRKNNTRRIVVLGGSTTYCIMVSDHETWPYFLEKDLGAGWEVFNLGVPGYTTVENLIQTAFQVQELHPDIAVYYEGWNDTHVIHVKNLKCDYSEFHGKSQCYTLQVDTTPSRSSIITFIRRNLLRTMPKPPKPDANAFSARPDSRALDLYCRNLKSIIALCKNAHIIPIMVPQVMNYKLLTKDKPFGWMPFLKDKDVKKIMKLYNKKMEEVCTKEKVGFVKKMLETQFTSHDFLDVGHFSPAGNQKFATILADFIRKQVPNKETRH